MRACKLGKLQVSDHALLAKVDPPPSVESEAWRCLPFWTGLRELGSIVEVFVGQTLFVSHGGPVPAMGSGCQRYGVEAGHSSICQLVHVYDIYARIMCPCARSGRFVLTAWLLMAQGCHWTLEQPSSSLLFRHFRFQQMCRAAFAA